MVRLRLRKSNFSALITGKKEKFGRIFGVVVCICMLLPLMTDLWQNSLGLTSMNNQQGNIERNDHGEGLADLIEIESDRNMSPIAAENNSAIFIANYL